MSSVLEPAEKQHYRGGGQVRGRQQNEDKEGRGLHALNLGTAGVTWLQNIAGGS